MSWKTNVERDREKWAERASDSIQRRVNLFKVVIVLENNDAFSLE